MSKNSFPSYFPQFCASTTWDEPIGACLSLAALIDQGAKIIVGSDAPVAAGEPRIEFYTDFMVAPSQSVLSATVLATYVNGQVMYRAE